MSCYDWYWLRVSIADRRAIERFARPKRLGGSFVVGMPLTRCQSAGCNINLNPYHAYLKWFSYTIFAEGQYLVLFDGTATD